MAKYPSYNLKIINRGISGDGIFDLRDRWQKDVVAELRGEASKHSADPHVVFPEGKSCGGIDHQPDILSVLIGVNDVWRRIMEGETSGAADLDEYESTYRQLLSQAKKECNSRIVICEPFMFCDDLNDPVFTELRRYIKAVSSIAKDFEAVLVPLQKLIDEQIKEVPPQKWSLDMVHPELWAHCWIAQQWLSATGVCLLVQKLNT